MYFRYSFIISSWKKGVILNLNKIEPLSSKDALWIWERNIWLSSMDFRYFFIIFPWKRARPFIWTNLNPLKSHGNALCHVWLKLAPWLCRRFSNRCTFAISLLAPLGKWQDPSFKELESPSHSNVLYQVLLKFASMVLETKAKMWKVYNNDDAGQLTNFANLSLQLMWP